MDKPNRDTFIKDEIKESYQKIMESAGESCILSLHWNSRNSRSVQSITTSIHQFFCHKHRNQPLAQWSITSKLTTTPANVDGEAVVDFYTVNLIEIKPDNSRAEKFELIFGDYRFKGFYIRYYDQGGQVYVAEYKDFSPELMLMHLGDRLGYIRGAGY